MDYLFALVLLLISFGLIATMPWALEHDLVISYGPLGWDIHIERRR